MWPYFLGVAVIVAAKKAYEYYTEDEVWAKSDTPSTQPTYTPEPINQLGKFVVWGRPNAGKTTFITQLLDGDIFPDKKTTTTSKKEYTNIPLKRVNDKQFEIEMIIDMPGTIDRLNDWLNQVKIDSHVFYMMNLAKIDDPDHKAAIRSDLKATADVLKNAPNKNKKIHIIASHVDKSKWQENDSSEVHNLILEDPDIRLYYESLHDVKGYFYMADLTNKESFENMLKSIIGDCDA